MSITIQKCDVKIITDSSFFQTTLFHEIKCLISTALDIFVFSIVPLK